MSVYSTLYVVVNNHFNMSEVLDPDTPVDDVVSLTPKPMVYFILAQYYDQFAKIWLDLGLWSNINKFEYDRAVFAALNRESTDIINKIIEFIPIENYYTVAVCNYCNNRHGDIIHYTQTHLKTEKGKTYWLYHGMSNTFEYCSYIKKRPLFSSLNAFVPRHASIFGGFGF